MKSSNLYIALFGLLLFVLSIFFAIKIIFSEKSDYFEPQFSSYLSKSSKAIKDKSNQWIANLSKKKKILNYYPAEEIRMEWTLVSPETRTEKLFRISFENINSYQFFCLSQVLSHHKLKYALKRSANMYQLYIELYSKSAATTLLDELAEYDLYGEMVPFKKELKY